MAQYPLVKAMFHQDFYHLVNASIKNPIVPQADMFDTILWILIISLWILIIYYLSH